MGADFLTTFLSRFEAVLALGMFRASAPISRLLLILATIEIAFLGIWWLYSHDNGIGILVFRVVAMGLFAWLIRDWQIIVGAIQESFVRLGLLVGGNQLDLGTAHSAGMAIIKKGNELSRAIQGYAPEPSFLNNLNVLGAGIAHPTTMMLNGIMAMLVSLIFLLCGVHIFATQLEFVMKAAIAFLTIPFAVSSKLAWISERTFGGVVGIGLKLAFLYMLASISIPALGAFPLKPTSSWEDAIYMLGSGVAILILQMSAAGLANSMMSGNASLSYSDFLPSPRTVISTTGLAAGGAGMIARAGAMAGTRMAGTMSRGGMERQMSMKLKGGR